MHIGAICGMLGPRRGKWEVGMQRSILFTALLALAAAGAPTGEARAQTLPGWKIDEICAKESAPGQCAAFEGRALKAVSSSWSFVLEPIRRACLAQVRSPLDRSWRLLADCIDSETLKALDKSAVLTARTPAEPVPPPKPPAPPAESAPPPPPPAAAAPPAPPAAAAAPPPPPPPPAAAAPPPPPPAASPPTEPPKQ
jgi:hypothetical protein